MSKKKHPVCPPLEVAQGFTNIYRQYPALPDIQQFFDDHSDLLVERSFIPGPAYAVQVARSVWTVGEWTKNKQIYTFSEALAADLFAMDDVNVPVDALHLPYPCFYVDVEHLSLPVGNTISAEGQSGIALGYFVLIDEVPYTDGEDALVCSVVVVMRDHDGNIRDTGVMFDADREHYEGGQIQLGALIATLTRNLPSLDKHIRNALLAAAYLSSSKPDITENPEQKQIYRPTRDPLRYASVRKWDVGMRYMHAQGSEQTENNVAEAGSEHAARRSPRAHVRKAHWHTYLVGKGRTERVVLWIPPTAVGMKGVENGKAVVLTADDLPAVVRSTDTPQ